MDFTELRREQRELSGRITGKIFDDLSRHVYSENLSGLEGYVGSNWDLNEKGYQARTVALHLLIDLRNDVRETVIAYTNWLIFRRMLNDSGWEKQYLPRSEEIDYEAISQYYTAIPVWGDPIYEKKLPSGLVRRSIEFMHQENKITPIGTIERPDFPIMEEAFLVPDRVSIKDYASRCGPVPFKVGLHGTNSDRSERTLKNIRNLLTD